MLLNILVIQHSEIFIKKLNKIHMPGIDTDPDLPDRHALDANPDPDPAK